MPKKLNFADRLRSIDTVVVAAPGGEFMEVSPEGELLSTIPVAPGRYRATRFLIACGSGNALVPGERVTVFPSAPRVSVTNYGALTFESAANPSFRLSDGERDERNRKYAMSQQKVMQLRLAKQFRALQRARGEDKAIDGAPFEPAPAPAPAPVTDAPAA